MQNRNLFNWSIVAALAGFIFGFDTVVISGANLPIKELWNTGKLFHGFFIMSMALWGTVIGSLFAGWPTEKYGRKKVLLFIGLLFSISALGTALAPDPYTFSFFRFIGGVGIGVSSVVAPTYISEIAGPATRGRLVALYQFNIVFGILIAYLSNYFLQGLGGENDWRWMLGVMFIPSAIYTFGVWRIPESPRWLLIHKNDRCNAKEILQEAGVEDADAEIDKIVSGIAVKQENIFTRKYRVVVMLAFFIAFFNQLSGINFILYYAPEIFETLGIGEKDSLLRSVALGGTNLIFTFVGLYLIDRVGRKKLLLWGSLGYIVSLTIVVYAIKATAAPAVLLGGLLLFIAAHAVGQGAVIWVFISEIFPNRTRALGQSFGASVHWVFAAIITLITPLFLDKEEGILREEPWIIFAFFAGMMVLQLLWVLVKMPETRGVSLEELEKRLLESD